MKRLQLPLCEADRRGLKAGETVLLNGTIYTARDAAHKRMFELLEQGESLPFDIRDAVIYYVGPTPATPEHVIGSAGPTTASRMDPYTPALIQAGLRGMIGKGRRNSDVKEAIQKYGAVYFVAVGGAGALLSKSVVSVKPIAFADLLSEAIVALEVVDFPCFVGIDTEGNDVYDLGDESQNRGEK